MTQLPQKYADVRFARLADAEGVCALYKQAYRSGDVDQAEDVTASYPFPQLLDTDSVAELIADDSVCWIVAERDGKVAGSAAARRNIGTDDDRVAEVFGIVVAEDHRGNGVGSDLLSLLVSDLGQSRFILCESRTALTAGWRVSRHCGFSPIGFEPHGHFTPAGYEAMLMTARVTAQAIELRNASPLTSDELQQFANVVLGGIDCPRPVNQPVVVRQLYSDDERISRPASDYQAGMPTLRALRDASDPSDFSVQRDDFEGPKLLAKWSTRGWHRSGVIGLRRLEGQEIHHQRYNRLYYVARQGEIPVGCLRAVWDGLDRRARILELQSIVDGIEGLLVPKVVDALAKQASGAKHVTVVVDVRADATELQDTLLQLGFWPTVYYPSLVADGKQRLDAVQFTRLLNRPFVESLDYISNLNWESANCVVASVVRNHEVVHEMTHTRTTHAPET